MSLSNTTSTYGGVAKSLHWLTMLLIFTAIPLGVIANDMAYDTADALAQKAWLFSLHKTVGVTVFFVALARVLWAVTQAKPGPLHPDRKAETFLAETVHWVLYAALIIVPLSGWVHHASTSGFAPILWPLGQSLPLVPQSEGLAAFTAGLHEVVTKVLAAAILLHIAGAVKHQVIDKDATLRRMLPGSVALPKIAPHRFQNAPVIAAGVAYLGAMGIGVALGVFQHEPRAAAPAATLDAVASEWQVQEGSIGITVQQLGSAVTGQFADWTAAIRFAETPVDGKHGDVTVTIAIGSLTLGSVTNQALGADFFDAGQFPTATFTADILPQGAGYVAQGNLTLKGRTVPVTLPFDLTIEGNTATMSGSTVLERLNYAIGETYPDGSTVGLTVDVAIALTAAR